MQVVNAFLELTAQAANKQVYGVTKFLVCEFLDCAMPFAHPKSTSLASGVKHYWATSTPGLPVEDHQSRNGFTRYACACTLDELC